MVVQDNPLLAVWDAPYEMPPFKDIEPEHFRPAFNAAFDAHKAEIAAIIAHEDKPSFGNTIEALEKSGRLLTRVSSVFFNLTSAHTNPALQEIERDIAPVFAKHFNEVYTNTALFKKVDALFEAKDELSLTPEQLRVLDRYHRGFVRSGAQLDEAGKARMSAISERLAELTTRFAQNVLADEADYKLVLEEGADLDGLPDFLTHAAARTASDLGLEGKYVITLARSSIEPFLQFSSRRDLREEAFKAWLARGGKQGETDNRAIIAEIVKLRQEKARLLGFDTYAAFKLDDSMAKSPAAARGLLMEVWPAAREKAAAEREALADTIRREGGNFDLAPWDWRYYAEIMRKRDFEISEAEIKPYFQLDKMIEAAFWTAGKLFGLSFRERHDVPVYHPDVRVWEVFGLDGRPKGLFLGDYFARPSKRSGAWMRSFRDQERLESEVLPVVINVLNCTKGGEGKPVLLSLDDARTLFHEFGHALHGLLSDVTYPMISGTSVSRDFVELPSQLYEHWLMTPEVLSRFALHYKTGEPMPEALAQRLVAARNFNQGFATVEYAACAILDLDLHERCFDDGLDIDAFEASALGDIEMPSEIALRHRPPHFLHLFAGDGYSAGYYSYLWSEVMDADAFAAFEETGDVFNKDVAKRLHDCIYSSGGKLDPADAYKAFRGRLPEVDALLKKRGLKAA